MIDFEEQAFRDDYDEDRAEEMRQMRDDRIYDSIRDEESVLIMEAVKELIRKAKGMMYFKNNSEIIGKDIIQNTLRELNLKVEEVSPITDKLQDIRLVEIWWK